MGHKESNQTSEQNCTPLSLITVNNFLYIEPPKKAAAKPDKKKDNKKKQKAEAKQKKLEKEKVMNIIC